jgi:hypothetical protein
MSDEKFHTCNECREFSERNGLFIDVTFVYGKCKNIHSWQYNQGEFHGGLTEACELFTPKDEGVEG